MSNRRRARGNAGARVRTDVPRPLLVGRCIEVWSSPDPKQDPALSAFVRFGAARKAFAAERGLTPGEASRVVPAGGPWSVAAMDAAGREAWVTAQLARAGATRRDLDRLRDEAERLHG